MEAVRGLDAELPEVLAKLSTIGVDVGSVVRVFDLDLLLDVTHEAFVRHVHEHAPSVGITRDALSRLDDVLRWFLKRTESDPLVVLPQVREEAQQFRELIVAEAHRIGSELVDVGSRPRHRPKRPSWYDEADERLKSLRVPKSYRELLLAPLLQRVRKN